MLKLRRNNDTMAIMTYSCGSQIWCGRWSWNKFPTNSGLRWGCLSVYLIVYQEIYEYTLSYENYTVLLWISVGALKRRGKKIISLSQRNNDPHLHWFRQFQCFYRTQKCLQLILDFSKIFQGKFNCVTVN